MSKRVWRKLDAVAYTESSTTAVRWDQKGWVIVEGVWHPLDADPAELVAELVGLIEEARQQICADWEADDLLRHALDRAREWQEGGDDGE